MFLDESEALTHPYLARCSAPRGTQSRIQAPRQATKPAMLGAFDPVHRRLLVHTSATKRSTDFIHLLDQLGAAYGTAERARPLVAVLDNGPIHTSKLTTKALAQRPWLTLESLPKYAPELTTSNDAGAISSSINLPIALSPMSTLSTAPSLMLSPFSTTSGNPIHRPFPHVPA